MNVQKINKEIITKIFTELSEGNDKPLLDSMLENVPWNWMGSGQWSKLLKFRIMKWKKIWTLLNGQFENIKGTIKPIDRSQIK